VKLERAISDDDQLAQILGDVLLDHPTIIATTLTSERGVALLRYYTRLICDQNSGSFYWWTVLCVDRRLCGCLTRTL